jgi:hypothetical protein
MTFSLFDVAFVGSLSAAPALWTPADITTALWLDAADASTITESGGVVSQWNDKSGNGRHVSQGTAGNRPVVATTSVNSLNTILFTQTSTLSANIRELRSSTAYTANRGSIFIVLKPASSQQASAAVFQSRNPGLEGFRAAPAPNNQDTVTSNIANTIGRINGTSIQTFSASQNFHTYSANTALILGAVYPAASNISFAWSVGRDQFAETVRGFNGEVAEVVVLPEVGTAATWERIEGYLAHRWPPEWGLVANLRNDHAYKSMAPTL